MPARPRSLAISALPATAATLAVLALTRSAPSFSLLGPKGALLGWLAFVTLITTCIPLLATALSWRGAPTSYGAPRAFFVRRAQRDALTGWGLSWGRSRRDLPWIALGIVASVALAWLVSRAPDVRAYYPRYTFVKAEPWLWLPSTLLFGAYGLAWETMFRGHLLLAPLADSPPPGAPRDADSPPGASAPRPADSPPPAPLSATALLLALQTALFAIAHLDKPPLEAWLSVPAGLFFGVLALRTRSVLPGFLLHFTVSTSVNLFCAYG